LKKEQKKCQEDFWNRVKSKRKNAVYKLPETPWKEENIMTRIKTGSTDAKKYFTNGGKMSGGVYTDKTEHWDFIGQVMRENIESNPLHFIEFAHVG